MIVALLRWVFGCRHTVTYRERRTVAGVPGVACFVCESCGRAWPVVERTASEHRRMQRLAKTRPVKPVRRAAVRDIRDRRRA